MFSIQIVNTRPIGITDRFIYRSVLPVWVKWIQHVLIFWPRPDKNSRGFQQSEAQTSFLNFREKLEN